MPEECRLRHANAVWQACRFALFVDQGRAQQIEGHIVFIAVLGVQP